MYQSIVIDFQRRSLIIIDNFKRFSIVFPLFLPNTYMFRIYFAFFLGKSRYDLLWVSKKEKSVRSSLFR